MESRFKGHYLLHDRGTPEDVQKLASIMAEKTKMSYEQFKQPHPPYEFNESASADVSYKWLRTYFLPDTLLHSVIFGFGFGGLLAAKLQGDFPARDISVVAINAPTSEGEFTLDSKIHERVSLYSSQYVPKDNNWSKYAKQVYDVPWLQHGIKNTKYGLAYLMMAYMQHEDISAAVSSLHDGEIAEAAGA
jgi:esterase/lipase